VFAQPILDLDRFGGSSALLATLAGIGLVIWVLYTIGFVGWLFGVVATAIRTLIWLGFEAWRWAFSWAGWAVFLALVATVTAIGVTGGHHTPVLPLGCGVFLLFAGVATCCAYMFVDVERYDVARGSRALHNPLPGQAPAPNLLRYGERLGFPLLTAAGIGVACGFALLNDGLYATIGQSWYRMESGSTPDFSDFFAYTLLNLLRVVDLLHLASSYNYVHASDVRQVTWQSSTLLSAFKSFFTLVLLQQIFASVRQGRVLSEVIADFWSPHSHLQERARGTLPQHGPKIIWPLLAAVREVPALTVEQREYLPKVFADVGPATVPILLKHLDDPHPCVRAVSAAALGLLHAVDAVPGLARLATDADDKVRVAVAESLAVAVGPGGKSARSASARNGKVGTRWRIFARRITPPVDPVPTAVAALRNLLTDPSATVRELAAHALAEIGVAGVSGFPDLVGLFKDADAGVRVAAASAAARVGGADAAESLSVLLSDSVPAVRVAAATALGELGKQAARAVPALTGLLRDADESVRTAAAEALGRVGPLGEETLKDLTGALESQDTLVRARAAEALGTIGASAANAAPALAAALSDENDRVRATAAQALGQMGEAAAKAAPALVRALQDGDTWVSALAAEALGEVGAGVTGTVPALVRSLRHLNPEVRANAAVALGKLGETAQAAAPELANASRDLNPLVRASAIAALGEVGEANTGAVLLAAVNDESPVVRAAAIEALGRGDVEGSAAIIAAAADASEEVRVASARALSRLGPDAIETLSRLLADERTAVTLEATRTLGKLGAAALPAGPKLLELVKTGEEDVREQAIRTIALIQPPEGGEAFLTGLRDPRSDIRVLASAGLIKATQIPGEAASALVEALRDPEVRVRANVERVLARLDTLPAEAVELLAVCATDADDGVRLGAVLALRKAPHAGVVLTALHHLLTDPNPRLRLLADETLLKANPSDAEAVAVLVASLADSSPRIRRAALELAASIGAALLGELRRRAEVETDPEVGDLLAEVIEHLSKQVRAEPKDQKAD
jgi:HEAT repeat protein